MEKETIGIRGFLMKDEILKKFENSVRTVFEENGWNKEDADAAMAWIKETLGIDRSSVISGV